MTKKLKVILYAVGAMAREMARIIDSRDDVEIVAAIDTDPAKVGKDLASFAGLSNTPGVVISGDADQTLASAQADIVLLTTTAFASEAEGHIHKCLEHGFCVVSIVQELVFPIGESIDVADRLQLAAEKYGVKAAAVGINPGFIMDVLPLVCSTPCTSVKKVAASRNVDFSPYGPDEMEHIGAGLTPEAFHDGVATGKIGHIGLLETTAMVAAGLGLQIDRLEQSKTPLIAKSDRRSAFVSIAKDHVCGLVQTVTGRSGNDVVLQFKMHAVVAPNAHEDGFTLGDHTRLEGTPNVDIEVKREIAQRGGIGTASVAVNTIPRLMAAEPGFHTLFSLGFPKIWTQSPLDLRTVEIERHAKG